MAILPNYLRRTTAILKMPQALSQGLSASAFLKKLQGSTGGYKRTTFLRDWRNVSGIEAKKDRFKYVRRDRLPQMSAIADVEWDNNNEYMYKVRAFVRKGEGEPLTERFVNIVSDRALTPEQVESEVFERWSAWEKYEGEVLERAQVTAGFHNLLADSAIE